MGFLRYNRWIIYITALVLSFYGFYFYTKGYTVSLLFFVWAATGIVANVVVKKKPIVAFGGLAAISFILWFILRSFIPEMRQSPNFEVFATLLTMTVGIMIDSTYWVYKYDKGKKFKTSYDD